MDSRILHQRKFKDTGYRIYENGLVEYLFHDEVKEAGILIKEIDGQYSQYGAHLSLGYHEASKLQFTIYGKKHRFYTKIKEGDIMPEGKKITADDLIMQHMLQSNKQLDIIKALVAEIKQRDAVIEELKGKQADPK